MPAFISTAAFLKPATSFNAAALWAFQFAPGLDRITRAKAMMALLGIVLLGGLMIIFVLIAGRRLRRLLRPKIRESKPPIEDRWY
ncbi:MAG: hypothetical protein N2C14_30190 [Planctomycetales bacterium]